MHNNFCDGVNDHNQLTKLHLNVTLYIEMVRQKKLNEQNTPEKTKGYGVLSFLIRHVSIRNNESQT